MFSIVLAPVRPWSAALMNTEWIQQQRHELRSIVDTIHVSLSAPSIDYWWCPRCHSQLPNNDTTIEKHLFQCKLKDIVPNPAQVQYEATSHQFYYTNCPAVVSLLQPPHQMTRDYTAELMQYRAGNQPRAPIERRVNLSDMMIEHQPAASHPAPVHALTTSESTNVLQVSEYAVSAQGRGAELMAPGMQPIDQRVHERVNQWCATQWHEQQSLAARSQFYEAVEWTARAEREQSGVASIDAQALEDWLHGTQQLNEQHKRARAEQDRDQRSRPEKYRAKNLITKKRPAQLQRDLVLLLFAQIQSRDNQPRDTQPRDNQSRDTQSRDTQPRDNQPRDSQSRDTQSRDNQSRDSDQRTRDREHERHRERDRQHREHYHHSEYDRHRDRDSEYDRHRDRRDEHHDRKRRHESEEYESYKRQRYR